ncbi:major facilitator superfamily domain-containing protein [Dichotomopilus funicola]|uniref:Major facilitator superfamily domain-containing protein n=1 Tax=Dichotomopilus funicola TaxID=1934379 RepID=A0AAN6V7S8_9PEZI|nr:major facilitator superfamily domain-containing protein [Dichotomopilus funicola]
MSSIAIPDGPGEDMDFAKEMRDEMSRLGGKEDTTTPEIRRGPNMTVPPSPPAKDLPPPPALLRSRSPSPIGTPSEPPSKPLPPPPMKKSESVRIPQPTKAPPPSRTQEPLAMNPPTRPPTAATQRSGPAASLAPLSTQRFSWATDASQRPIKYGQGKYGRVELVPQPSDDSDDPLNWPMWRKELNFYSLLLMVAMTGVTKTMFMAVNAQLAQDYQVSYTSVTALTGVPLILSAMAGLLCLVASRVCGKRPLYLTSLLLVFIGTVWSTNVAGSYAQCMAARVFQGLGWGAFDTLVLGSIQDTYFEHERRARMAVYSIVAIATTWGPPLIGGVASQGPAGFSLQPTILSAFFVVAIPAIALGAPETAFDRTHLLAQTPATATTDLKAAIFFPPRQLFSLDTLAEYTVKLKPYAYHGSADFKTLLQAPRAFATPTTMLLAVVSFLPCAALWGLTSSLSLLFSPVPFSLSPGTLGALFLAPFLLATAATGITSFLPVWQNRFTPRTHMVGLATGTILAFIGILTFSLHLSSTLAQTSSSSSSASPFQQVQEPSTTPTPIPTTSTPPLNLNLPALSLIIGLLAAGTALLDATAAPLIRQSTAFTGSSLAVSMRNTADMAGGVACWRAVGAGVFVLGLSGLLEGALRGIGIGMGVALVVVSGLAGGVWWVWGEGMKRWDGRVMGLVDLEMLRMQASFFDMD